MDKPTLAYLEQLQQAAETELAMTDSMAALEAWRVKYLGRKGSVSLVLRNIKNVPVEERQMVGQASNQLRQHLTRQYAQQQQTIEASVVQAYEEEHSRLQALITPGHLHPLTLTIRRIQYILSELGFQLVEGPLIESPQYNFDNLNMPLEHPARAETDTFYVSGGNVLRTSTSPVQIRAVLENHLHPPFSVFSPGRVFRAEKVDATHSHTFHQFEGLSIGTDVSIANFKGVIERFFSQFFGSSVTTRLRPHYFPFTEPSFEVDISCVFCQGGCPICKHTGWIEVMGAGMVHPTVLKNMNIDPQQYQGYAFGGAIDRLTMLRHNINDIRLFWSGDLRFLRQF